MKKLLLFGGTTEGRQLALEATNLGFSVTVCVATEYGKDCLPPEGLAVHMGRLTTEEMAALMTQDFALVLDATHPYATVVSRNIKTACLEAGLPYLRFLRPECEHDGCVYADSVAHACALVPEGNVLMATGSKEVACAAAIPDYQNRVFARVLPVESSLDACHVIGLDDYHILAGKGPFSTESNVETMKTHNICSMITKDSGPSGGFPEKLEAANRCGVQVIVVRRPLDAGRTYDEILQDLEGHL